MDLKTLFKISYGMYIVGAHKEDKLNAQIANTVFQVTAEPPTIGVSIHRDNLTNDYIRSSGAFSVSVLRQETPMTLIGNFGFKSGRDVDKFADVRYRIGSTGSPIVEDETLGFIEARVISQLDVGTHTIFVGEIVEAETLAQGEVMTYAYYHQVKRGSSPKNAPTFAQQAAPQTVPANLSGASYRCTVCGYLYEPAKGDPEAGVKPGTPFADLPETWQCPICGAAKEMFEKE